MPLDEETSIGAWIKHPEDAAFEEFDLEDLAEFDAYLEREYPGKYKRSEHFRAALLLYLEVHKQFDELPEWDRPDSPGDLVRHVTSAMEGYYDERVEGDE